MHTYWILWPRTAWAKWTAAMWQDCLCRSRCCWKLLIALCNQILSLSRKISTPALGARKQKEFRGKYLFIVNNAILLIVTLDTAKLNHQVHEIRASFLTLKRRKNVHKWPFSTLLKWEFLPQLSNIWINQLLLKI